METIDLYISKSLELINGSLDKRFVIDKEPVFGVVKVSDLGADRVNDMWDGIEHFDKDRLMEKLSDALQEYNFFDFNLIGISNGALCIAVVLYAQDRNSSEMHVSIPLELTVDAEVNAQEDARKYLRPELLAGFYERRRALVDGCQLMEMDVTEAIYSRHSVRRYIDRPIEAEKLDILSKAVEDANAASGLNIQLVVEEPKAFNGLFITTYGQFSGVKNYFVMAGPKGKEAEEKIGYYGEKLVILAQMLGLNTCWVGLTYKKIPGTYTLRTGDVVHCVIALGYGENEGVQHPLKPAEKFYEAAGEVPEWFRAGLNAALMAPTAVNQQKFKFIFHEGGRVEVKTFFSPWGYTQIDLGIVKYHFEVGAGKENFDMNPQLAT